MPFNNFSNPEMIAKSAAVSAAFTPEKYAYLLSLLPTPQSYAASHDRFEASYAAALKGDPAKVKACEADRLAVNQDMSILRAIAKAVAPKAPNVSEELGLGPVTESTASSAVALTIPVRFKVVYTPNGDLAASVAQVPGAKGYQIWACDSDPNVEANWRMATSSTKCQKIMIPGLNRAKPNWLKIRAIRSNSVGPWSNLVILPV